MRSMVAGFVRWRAAWRAAPVPVFAIGLTLVGVVLAFVVRGFHDPLLGVIAAVGGHGFVALPLAADHRLLHALHVVVRTIVDGGLVVWPCYALVRSAAAAHGESLTAFVATVQWPFLLLAFFRLGLAAAPVVFAESWTAVGSVGFIVRLYALHFCGVVALWVHLLYVVLRPRRVRDRWLLGLFLVGTLLIVLPILYMATVVVILGLGYGG